MQPIDPMKQFGPTGGSGALLPTEDDPVQMPLGLGPVDGDLGADLSGAAEAMGPGKGRGALLLVGVLLVAAGTLYGMRLTGGVDAHDAQTADAEKKIDQALKRFGAADGSSVDPAIRQNIDAIFKDTETVLAKFGEDPTSKQVGLDHVQKNPFALVLIKRESGPTAAVQAIDKVKEQRLKELRKELESLNLQSLMNGKVALAVINGKVTREGDVIGSFTITSIAPSGVKLAADGNLYTLSMKKPEELNP
jgi:hypothetical protein